LDNRRVKNYPAPPTLRIIRFVAIVLTIASTAASASARGLWVPNENSSTLTEFQGILQSGSTAPHRINSGNDLDGSSCVAFDHKGNLWESNFNSNSIVEYTKAQIGALKTNSTPTAIVTIGKDSGSFLNGPDGIAFDAAGNLWVGSERGQQILKYTPAQLAQSGNPSPDLVLNANSFNFSSPSLPVFDRAGNLWVVDEDIANVNGGSGMVFKYTRAQLSGLAGFQNIDPVFGLSSGSFQHLEGLAFDLSGSIWLADEDASLVYKFRAVDLKGQGLSQNVTPAVILSPTSITDGSSCTQSLDAPYGVAVDALGALYVANTGSSGVHCFGSLAKFSPASIKTSGSPTPRVFISSDASGTNLDAPNYLTFGAVVP